ncbi:MAG TPA: Gfo/Idh/MocA family oxidoreductase [Bacteroidales bacterium]|nr:Gfo/Idh/MocA family oxidoreductase [Bacteroidales bacterium]
MINVGIVGSFSAINKHTNALGKIPDTRITGRWIPEDGGDTALEFETGNSCIHPEELAENSDALIITGSGRFCSSLVVAALRKAKHVFLYPAVLNSVNEANQLIKLAREANVILKAGKTGKTDARGLTDAIHDPSGISMVELQHYHRLSDADNHHTISEALLTDLEIVNSLIRARVISIKAKGLCMLSPQPEIINARLEFDNGCAVNYNCNLVAAQNEFLGTVVLNNRILKYNFITHELTNWFIHRINNQDENPILTESRRVEHTDLLATELSDFLNNIHSDQAFLSLRDSGFEAFLLADRILEKVMKTLVRCT